MLLLLLLQLGAFFSALHGADVVSTVRIRLTNQALQFFNKIGHHIVDYEIWKITFPAITLPIEGGPGTGEVNVTELNIRAFESPKFSFKFAPPNGIAWNSSGGSAKILGDWHAVYNIYLSGYVKAKANDIRVYMQTNVLVRDERPQIEVTDCVMDVDHLDVSIGGGVIPWIVNLFRAQLAV
ncbi:unnamed protein product, partial [Gongylonema pulchrum]|uniref:BPI1 domain-containing protein n=1 Tax=Gongylonema pulchrum TaxID=637853 RepID=A0A183EZ87_9BILA